MGLSNKVKISKEGDDVLVSLHYAEGMVSPKVGNAIADSIQKIDFSGKLILDMGNVEYLDSSGLSVILVIYKSSINSKRPMRIINANDQIKDVFRMCSLYEGNVLE